MVASYQVRIIKEKEKLTVLPVTANIGQLFPSFAFLSPLSLNPNMLSTLNWETPEKRFPRLVTTFNLCLHLSVVALR